MDDYNVIQILDKIKKEIERGALPMAISEIDSTVLLLDRKIAKGNGKRFGELHKPHSENNMELEEMRQKTNEIIRYLNERFPLN